MTPATRSANHSPAASWKILMGWMDAELLRMPSLFHPAGGTGITLYLAKYFSCQVLLVAKYCSLSLADSITALHPFLFLSVQ
jgi:hypothetical protein